MGLDRMRTHEGMLQMGDDNVNQCITAAAEISVQILQNVKLRFHWSQLAPLFLKVLDIIFYCIHTHPCL